MNSFVGMQRGYDMLVSSDTRRIALKADSCCKFGVLSIFKTLQTRFDVLSVVCIEALQTTETDSTATTVRR